MAEFLQFTFSGLTVGAVYALVALGFTLIYSASDVVNFAQGEFVMVPAFVAVVLMEVVPIPFPLIYLVTLAFMALFGIVFQRVAYYPLRNRTFLPVVISTIGVSIFLKNGAQIVFGAEPRPMPRSTSSVPINLAGVAIDPQYIVIILVTLVLLVFQYYFFEKTSLGKKMQATVTPKRIARRAWLRKPNASSQSDPCSRTKRRTSKSAAPWKLRPPTRICATEDGG
jgi:branched-chain amino acid transport system permease protein